MVRIAIVQFMVLLLPVALAARAPVKNSPKVVILGFDGADSRLVEQWMDEGRLPNLSRLRSEGHYSPLAPTNPPQTPVSWSSFATGCNPGRTEIFDFLKRDPKDYLPDFAMVSESKRVFLFGTRNGPVLGLAASVLALFTALLVLALVRVPRRIRVSASVLLGIAAGLAAYVAAGTYLPAEVPDAINNRKGRTLWQLAGEAGYQVQVIRVPATFPADRIENGHLISGLGVPDMRGRVGTPAYYTSDPAFDPGDNEFSLELIRLSARRGRVTTRIVGPYNKSFCDYAIDRRLASIADPGQRVRERRTMERELKHRGVACRIDLPLALAITDSTCTVSTPGMSRVLHVGEWSDWFILDFPVNVVVDRFQPVRGMARFKLLALEPEVELYLSPINFHPDCHPVAFSWPPDHSEAIRKRFGLYKTLGWALDTWSLPSGVGDETLYLEDMRFTVDKYEEIMEGLLGDGTDDLYIQIFFFTDRIGHLFWQFLDEGHPLYDPVKARRYGPEVLGAYRRMDAIVGKARRLAGDDAVVIVLSDHGFSSFRRGVNYNTWLVRNGFMKLKSEGENPATLEKLFDTRDLFAGVDWSRTKAYALGLGSIYINLAGRERDGVVQPGAEYEGVCRDIQEGLEGLIDPLTGAHPVTRVWTRDEMYTGYDPDLIPDLRAGNNLNYRVSWQTTLGGVPPDLIEDNLRAWSGDHCSNDPDLVPGILFINRKLDNPHPGIMDIMPTVLTLMGIEVPPEIDGKPLL